MKHSNSKKMFTGSMWLISAMFVATGIFIGMTYQKNKDKKPS